MKGFLLSLLLFSLFSIQTSNLFGQCVYLTGGNGVSDEDLCDKNLSTVKVNLYAVSNGSFIGDTVKLRAYIQNSDSLIHYTDTIIAIRPGAAVIPVTIPISGPGNYASLAWITCYDGTDSTEGLKIGYYQFYYSPLTECRTIRGKAYLDKNQNCIFDTGDEPLINRKISSTDDIDTTDTNGDYIIYSRKSQFVSISPPRYISTDFNYYLEPSCNGLSTSFNCESDTVIDWPYNDSIHPPFNNPYISWYPISTNCATPTYSLYISHNLPTPEGKVRFDFGDGNYKEYNGPQIYESMNYQYNSQGLFFPKLTVYRLDTIYEATNLIAFAPEFCGNVSGRAYFDLNGNCTYDSLVDNPIFNTYVRITIPSLQYSTILSTDSDGYYRISIPDTCYYEIEVFTYDTNSFENQLEKCTDNYKRTGPSDSLDFGFKCNSTQQNFNAYASCSWFRPGREAYINLYANNNSCSTQSGTISIELTSVESFVTSSPEPDRINGKKLEWDFNEIDVSNFFFSTIVVLVDSTVTIGQEICHPVFITPIENDVDTADNFFNACTQVRTSYDPNDKTCFLPNGKEVSEINESDTDLIYRIRFQNTGNDTAFNIYVVDTIEANLELRTFEVISSSHALKTYIGNNRVIRFQFDNILLPDDKTNEHGSHGEVVYSISRKKDLPIGTTLKNTGYIYFDYNEAIITNTSATTIVSPDFITETSSNPTFKIYPNPTSGVLNISFSETSDFGHVTIKDMPGKEILKQNIASKTSISLGNLPSGLYLITVEGQNSKGTQKLILNSGQ